MSPESFQALARYNRWMNDKLYGLAGELTDEERRRDRGAFFRSIHATLNHVLVADRIWLGRFTGVKLEPGLMGPNGIRALDQELYPDFDGLRAGRRETDEAIESFVQAVTPEQLMALLRYGKNEVATWQAVLHLFNHQTHHRGQVTTLFTQAGRDPGVTDLSAMFREEAQRDRSRA